MRTREQVSAEKLRGGFYSPPKLVEVCLDRVSELLGGRGQVTLLEPSAGDGAFLRGLARHPLASSIASVTATEPFESEAAKCRTALTDSGLEGCVLAISAFDPFEPDRTYDAAVGNPPFVRFQFVSKADRSHAEELGRRIGTPFSGVTNLWVPVLLSALAKLREGGVFSFIVPAECLTGKSARVVRDWLALHATQLRVDLFPPGSFPGALQEVVVLSGVVTRESAHGPKVDVHDHGLGDSWRHLLDGESTTWTGLLLRPDHLSALAVVQSAAGVHEFSAVAKLSVATVTGANDFFCFDSATRSTFELEALTRPLLDRIRRAPGLEYRRDDRLANEAHGHPVWMMDSSLVGPLGDGARAYVEVGERRELHTRYKTRIRDPWWKVPIVRPGSLMMSKRSNQFPRLVHNVEGVVTTDTIYQGSPRTEFAGRERDIVGSFHNSLTVLSAEVWGRSFGGGVLELVPSEITRLVTPVVAMSGGEFIKLDRTCRAGTSGEDLIEATDAVIVERLGIDRDLWKVIVDARTILRNRRLARTNRSPELAEDEPLF